VTRDVFARPPAPAEATAPAGQGASEAGAPRAARARTRPGALLRATRPRQWVKNVLVLAPPAAIGAVAAWPQALSAFAELRCVTCVRLKAPNEWQLRR
jgi:hypothetical protein